MIAPIGHISDGGCEVVEYLPRIRHIRFLGGNAYHRIILPYVDPAAMTARAAE